MTTVCPDSWLRPIRDPGPDAVDETIQRLGTPAQKALNDLESELAKLREIARELKELQKVLEG